MERLELVFAKLDLVSPELRAVPPTGALGISPSVLRVFLVGILLLVLVSVGVTSAVARSKTSLGRILRLAAPERCRLLVATFFLLVQTICSMPLMWVVGQFLDIISDHINDAGGEVPVRTLAGMMVIVASAAACSSVSCSASTYVFGVAGERISRRLRGHFFRALLVQDMAFFDLHQSGEWLNRLVADAVTVQEAASVNLANFLILTSGEYQNALASAGSVAGETLGGLRMVRAFGHGETHQLGRYTCALDEAFNHGIYRAKVGAIFSVVAGVVVQFAIVGGMAFGGLLVTRSMRHVSGGMKPGALTSFVMYAGWASSAVGALTGLYSAMSQAVGASRRVFEVIEREPSMPSTLCESRLLRPATCEGSISFEGVFFAYASEAQESGGSPGVAGGTAETELLDLAATPAVEPRDALRGLTFEVDPGSVLALVGPSGAGKSTIMALILRLYDPRRGVVRLDGCDLRALDPRWLRQQIGVVTQEPVLFSTTIRENICLGLSKLTADAEVEEASRTANAHEFISRLPQGYEAVCGERGVRLSGGERQRIAIARALLPRPQILLLDEATSALDAQSEQLVQEALDKLLCMAKSRPTVVMIAHRLSTVQSAQVILVIKDGRILEKGTHQELLAQGGLYTELASHQNLAC